MRARRTLSAFVATTLAGATLYAAPAVADPAEPPPGKIRGSYIVTFKDVKRDDVEPQARRMAGEQGAQVSFIYRDALRGFAARNATEQAAQAWGRDPKVAAVEQDQEVHAVGTQDSPPWGLDRIDQRNLPLSSTYTYNATGAGVTAYVLDTGIRTTHSQFGGRALHGYDYVDGDSTADDCNGHGTHVAGTIGGSTYGVAKAVSMVGVRVLGCGGSGSVSGVIAGVNWVTAHANRPAVANMSLSAGASNALDTAVRNSVSGGITYAVAAGNGDSLGQAQNACGSSPARAVDAITVSATNSSDTKASWANYGSCVDLFAPGVSITSAWYTGDYATRSGSSGTSMATPHAAGAAALYLQDSPSASPASVAYALTSNATTGVVGSPGSESPNRLLYAGFVGADQMQSAPSPSSEPVDPDPTTPTLTSGDPVDGTSAASGGWKDYKIFVPAGASQLAVTLSGSGCWLLGCSPKMDLYVRGAAKPTTSTYDCRSVNATNSESCSVSSPAAGWWYVGVYTDLGSSSKAFTLEATVS